MSGRGVFGTSRAITEPGSRILYFRTKPDHIFKDCYFDEARLRFNSGRQAEIAGRLRGLTTGMLHLGIATV